jgi:hypothetical protein
MSDKMMAEMVKQLYWEEGEDALWQKFKGEFVQKPEAARLQDLHAVNQWLGEEDQLTREAASLLTKQREMEHWHRQLKALGR